MLWPTMDGIGIVPSGIIILGRNRMDQVDENPAAPLPGRLVPHMARVPHRHAHRQFLRVEGHRYDGQASLLLGGILTFQNPLHGIMTLQQIDGAGLKIREEVLLEASDQGRETGILAQTFQVGSTSMRRKLV